MAIISLCISSPPRQRGSIWRAGRSTSGRSTSSTNARRRSTPPSACARGARFSRAAVVASTIVSGDTGRRVDVAHWSELRDNHELRLLGRLLHFFQAEGLELHTRSESPVGAGIAGSSALNIAVCGALVAWTGQAPHRRRDHADCDERRGAGDRRADRRAGLPSGALRRHLRRGARRRRRAPRGVAGRGRGARAAAGARLHRRDRATPASTTGKSPSGTSTATATCSSASGASATSPAAMREALERGAWDEVGRQIAEEWENRKRLAPGVTTPEIDAILAAARAAGASRRQGLRRRRRRLPLLPRRARPRPGHPRSDRRDGRPAPRLHASSPRACASTRGSTRLSRPDQRR